MTQDPSPNARRITPAVALPYQTLQPVPDNPRRLTPPKNRTTRRWAILLGAGIALFPVHNQWLTNLTSINGQPTLFLPALGTVMWVMGALLFILNHWEDVKQAGLGDRRVFIPLLVISVAIGLSGISREVNWENKLAPLLTGGSLFAVYFSARVLGKDMFLPLGIGAAVASLGVIVYQLTHPGTVTGGFVFEGNYDIVAGYVLIGATLSISRWRWALAGLATMSMLLTGSPEALFGLGVIAVSVLIRRDWSGKLVIVAGVGAFLLIQLFVLGQGQTLYTYTVQTIQNQPETIIGSRPPISYRIEQIEYALTHIKPFGDGYNLTNFREGIVHNTPLIIIQQLGYPGILAGLAWLWVCFFCLAKSRWKYALIVVLALSVWDHYVWTQLAPYFWAIIGVAMTDKGTDLIFRSN